MIRDALASVVGTLTGRAGNQPEPTQRNVTFDGGTRTDTVAVGGRGSVDAGVVADAYRGIDTSGDLEASQANHLQSILDEPATAEKETPALAAQHASAGVSEAEYVATYAAGVSAAIDAAFGRLEGRLAEGNDAVAEELGRVRDDLTRDVESVFADVQTGLSAYHEDDLNVDDEKLLDGIGIPVFMLDANHEVVAWNHAIEQLTQVDREDALGIDHVSEAFYPDGRRAKTLADKIVDAPRRADAEFDVPRADTGDAGTIMYSDTSTMVTGDGVERHISFSATPIFRDGELVAVLEIVQDRTEDVRRHEGISELVEELLSTMTAMAEGDLSARASFEDDDGVVEDELLAVVDRVNGLGERLEGLTDRVDEQTEELATAVIETTSSAHTVEERVEEQSELLDEVAGELESFSANMEEVAASSDEVASAAEQAKAAADSGLQSSEGAREATDEVVEMSADLVETVTELESQMDAIEDVVEVIAEVADQTNLLALNANIEAARAGEAGSGFEVVADEVKNLANETRTHTEEIADRIEDIQSQANETVVAVEESNEQVRHAGDEIEDALIALEEIADAVDEAATGVTEVAQANDEQAATVEEVMATVEDVNARAGEAEEAIISIVEASESQTEAIEELSMRVEELTSGRSD